MSKITLGGIKFNKKEFDTELKNIINSQLGTISNNHINAIKKVIGSALRNSNFYRNFTTGSDLVVGLGIPIGEEKIRIEAIVNAVVNNIKVNFTKKGSNQYIASLSIYVELDEIIYSYISNIGEANVTTEKGENIPWLKWVLVDGDVVIIKNYDVKQSPGLGRSGGGIMIKGQSASYRIPTEYSGTIEDNWITRAIERAESNLNKVVENIFKEMIS